MIVLPLGLGTKLKRPPWVTLAFVLVWALVAILDGSDDRIFGGIFNVVAETGVRDSARDLFVDYCTSRKGELEACKRYSVLVWTGFPGKGEAPAPELEDALAAKLDAEHEAADAVREELVDCSDSKRCFVYKDILWKFLDGSRQKQKPFSGLKSYKTYASAIASYRRGLRDICKENQCLVRSYITPASLVAAQVRHGGFFHLASNIFMLVVFGIYAEQRTSRWAYLATLLVGGTAGMALHAAFFSSGDTIALGGSANVSAAMGLFFVFFFKQNMRLLVWLPRKLYAGTAYRAPVMYVFPLIFILSDVIGGLDNGFGELQEAGVAHVAHLGGFVIGALVAWVTAQIFPLPLPFVYSGEIQDLQKLGQGRDVRKVLEDAGEMIRVNPDNVHALEIGCGTFLRWAQKAQPNEDGDLVEKGRAFINEHLSSICAISVRNGQLLFAGRLLAQIPMSLPYRTCLARLGQLHMLALADFCATQGAPILALRLYDLFIVRFPSSTRRAGVEATALQVLACLRYDASASSALASFARHHQGSRLVPMIELWNREREAA